MAALGLADLHLTGAGQGALACLLDGFPQGQGNPHTPAPVGSGLAKQAELTGGDRQGSIDTGKLGGV